MANNKSFKIKNGLQAGRYLGSNGVETAGTVGYSLSSASYDSVSQSLGSGNTSPSTFKFNSDGTKLFCQDNNDRVYEYALSTAYDITSASLTTNFYLGSQTTSATSLAFNNDGTKMYIGEFTNDTILQYSLSTGFDVSTTSYDSVTLDVSSQSGNSSVLLFNSDGTKLWVSDGATPAIYQYNLTTGFDLSTGSYASKTLNLNISPVLAVNGFDFNSDGTQLLVIGSSSTLYKYDLSTAYDITTATRDTSVSFSVSSQDASPTDFILYNNGQKMLILGASNDTIYQYSTSQATQSLDLSTGGTFSFTPSGATTVSFTNPPASGTATGFTLEVVNTGGYALTWPSSVKWHLGTAPTATATKELYTFVTTDGGTTYYGKLAGSDIA